MLICKVFFSLMLIIVISINAQTYFQGADLSFVRELESCGVQWKEKNIVKDVFTIFKDNGANTVRFRIWHTPVSGYNGFTDSDSLIARAKNLGYKVILNFHYSDTWTDPANQKCPSEWNSVVSNNTVLADSLYKYTKATLQKLKDKGSMPDFVQVGNETNGGMCFSGDGVVTWPTDWTRMKLLYNAGIKAVREIDPSCKIILHVADPQHAEWWAGELYKNGVTDFNIIGISYYPIIHTTKKIPDIRTIITNIKNTYKKDVMIVETSVPWSDSWNDNTTNMMNGTPEGYGSASSPENQAKWLTDLTNIVKSSGGIGIIYWEPEWVASGKAGCTKDFGGSTWENQTFFDFNNNLIPNGGITFFGKPIVNIDNLNKQSHISSTFTLSQHGSTLHIQSSSIPLSNSSLSLYTLDGALITTFALAQSNNKTSVFVTLDNYSANSKISLAKLISNRNVYTTKVIR